MKVVIINKALILIGLKIATYKVYMIYIYNILNRLYSLFCNFTCILCNKYIYQLNLKLFNVIYYNLILKFIIESIVKRSVVYYKLNKNSITF